MLSLYYQVDLYSALKIRVETTLLIQTLTKVLAKQFVQILAPGETDLTWDAGIYEFVCEGVIGDRVWLDFNIYQTSTNCNGIQDEGEPGLQGVKVILKDSEGNVIDFTFTDEHGNYLFEGLCTDNDCYTVHIDESTLPNGTTPTAVNVGSDDAIDSDGSGVKYV
jgi:hypothetical protein